MFIKNQKQLKSENENLKNQLKLKSIECDQLKVKCNLFEEECNKLKKENTDVIIDALMSFDDILHIVERNDYNKPQQKISQICECVNDRKMYFDNKLTSVEKIKNRTIPTTNNK